MKGKESSSGFRPPRWRNGRILGTNIYHKGRKALNVCLSLSLSQLEPYVTSFIFLGSRTLVMEMFGWVGWLVGCAWRDESRAETGIYVDGGFGRCGYIKAVR